MYVKNTTALLVKSTLASAFFLFLLFWAPRNSQGADRNLGFGGEIGYCAANRTESGLPETVQGGALGLHVMYMFDDTWGLSLDGNLDWHPPYQTYVLEEITAETEDGGTTTGLGWAHGPYINRSFLTTAALSVIYLIDVMRIQPYLAAGINASRSILKSGARYYKGSALGIRITVGADYMFSNISGVGLLLNNDISLMGVSSFSSRIAIMVRFVYFFDVKNFVKRRGQS